MVRRATPRAEACQFVTHAGLRVLADAQDVPPLRYAEQGSRGRDKPARTRR